MTTGEIIGLIAFLVAVPVILIVVLAAQQHDKDKRRKEWLPSKKYHSIVDEDVTTVYTIQHK